MNKAYRKPILYVETFNLTEHISADCYIISLANHTTAFTCAYDDGTGLMMFLDNNAACTGQAFPSDLPDLDDYVSSLTDNNFCYNTVVSGQLFSS